jgi:Hemerythrin HHE cation binding domain
MSSHSSDLDQGLAARLRSRRVELRSAMGGLESALAAPANDHPDRWVRQVHGALLALTSGMREHIEVTEGPDGLHQELVESAPRLSGPVSRLNAEHDRLEERLRDLVDRVEATDLDVDAIRDAGTDVLDLFMRHRQRGADLVYEAYEFDVGGSG